MNLNPDSKNSKHYTSSTKVALTGVMAALIAVTTVTSISLPPPLSSINFAPVIIFTVAIIFGPIIGAASTALGCAIGYIAGVSMGTINPGGALYLYWIGLVLARTPMSLSTSFLRNKSQTVGMVIGVVLETFVFFAIDFVFFGIGYAVFDLGTLVDLAFIPVAFVVILAVRRILGTKYLA